MEAAAAAAKPRGLLDYQHVLLFCSYIDAAGHPDDFVRGLFQQAVVDTQLAAGKVAAVQSMQESLTAAAAEAYPEAAAAYR